MKSTSPKTAARSGAADAAHASPVEIQDAAPPGRSAWRRFVARLSGLVPRRNKSPAAQAAPADHAELPFEAKTRRKSGSADAAASADDIPASEDGAEPGVTTRRAGFGVIRLSAVMLVAGAAAGFGARGQLEPAAPAIGELEQSRKQIDSLKLDVSGMKNQLAASQRSRGEAETALAESKTALEEFKNAKAASVHDSAVIRAVTPARGAGAPPKSMECDLTGGAGKAALAFKNCVQAFDRMDRR